VIADIARDREDQTLTTDNTDREKSKTFKPRVHADDWDREKAKGTVANTKPRKKISENSLTNMDNTDQEKLPRVNTDSRG
jgi:hypothetical protein